MQDEFLIVVDEQDQIIPGRFARKEVHQRGDLWHRTSSIFVIDDTKRVLCHRRSLKVHSSPGKLAHNFGGHMTEGESPLLNARRELEEELGIKPAEEEFKFIGKESFPKHKHIDYIYVVKYRPEQGQFLPDPEEVSEIFWLDLPAVIAVSQNPEIYNFPVYNTAIDYLQKLWGY